MLNEQLLESFDRAEFHSATPCPWSSFDGLLTTSTFAELNETFPSLEHFEKHAGRPRLNGQRPHDRWYLALEHSIYDNKKPGQKGCVAMEELASPWQDLIQMIRRDRLYQEMVQDLLGSEKYDIRCAWHVASNGADVSPHIDDPLKAGTHIFYFHTDADWNESWGGQTLFLAGLKCNSGNPEVDDFAKRYAAPIVNNKSMLFKNTPTAWHGVEPIACPEGKQRRLFNVIFQRPSVLKQRRSLKSRLKAFLVGRSPTN